MKRILIAIVIVFSSVCFTVNAQTAGTKSNTGRQVNQQARIREGRKSGELTRAELKRLEREQKKIQIEKRMAQADGKVTPAEKRFLRREQNRAGRHIAKQKNDLQSR
jgi:hypothetical protein